MILEDPTATVDVQKDTLDRLSIRGEHETAWNLSAGFTRRNGEVFPLVQDDVFGK